MSRILLLNEGDANTIFFHISATDRKRRNKINFFKDDTGNWINEHHLIMSHVLKYFTDTFTTSHSLTSWISPLGNPYIHTNLDLNFLDTPLLDIEIKRAIYSFNFQSPMAGWPPPVLFSEILENHRSFCNKTLS